MSQSAISLQEIEKTTAVILNKVEGLQWHYYDINFEPDSFDPSGLSNRRLLDLIVQEGRTYHWTGDQGKQTDNLLGAVIQILHHTPDFARDVFRRIFDLNEIPNESNAHVGIMGRFNLSDRRHRERIYQKNLPSYKCRSRPAIVAEGDSWFQFPAIALGPIRIDPIRDIWITSLKAARTVSKASPPPVIGSATCSTRKSTLSRVRDRARCLSGKWRRKRPHGRR